MIKLWINGKQIELPEIVTDVEIAFNDNYSWEKKGNYSVCSEKYESHSLVYEKDNK
jgi:hypothetical protein